MRVILVFLTASCCKPSAAVAPLSEVGLMCQNRLSDLNNPFTYPFSGLNKEVQGGTRMLSVILCYLFLDSYHITIKPKKHILVSQGFLAKGTSPVVGWILFLRLKSSLSVGFIANLCMPVWMRGNRSCLPSGSKYQHNEHAGFFSWGTVAIRFGLRTPDFETGRGCCHSVRCFMNYQNC